MKLANKIEIFETGKIMSEQDGTLFLKETFN